MYITNFSWNDITILDFGGSITNFPSEPTNVLEIGSTAGLIQPFGIDIIEAGGSWYGILTAYGSGKVYKMDFGTDLFSEPVFTEIGSVSLGSEVSIDKEGEEFIGYVLGRSSGFVRYEFGQTMGNTAIENSLGDYGFFTDVRSMWIVKESPEWRGYIGHFTNGKLYRMEFSGDCSLDVSKNSTIEVNPIYVKYSIPGEKLIELTAFSTNGNKDTVSQVITVTSDTAPDIDLTTDGNVCISNTITFSPITSSMLTTYNWNFGDGTGTSTDPNPSYQYASTGTYTIRLAVSDGTCGNFTEQDIKIYIAPVASFTVPTGQVCSNSPIEFTNTTTFDAGSPVSWEWDFGDQSAVSIEQSPSHPYTAGGTYPVTFTATLNNGCVDPYSQDLTFSG